MGRSLWLLEHRYRLTRWFPLRFRWSRRYRQALGLGLRGGQAPPHFGLWGRDQCSFLLTKPLLALCRRWRHHQDLGFGAEDHCRGALARGYGTQGGFTTSLHFTLLVI